MEILGQREDMLNHAVRAASVQALSATLTEVGRRGAFHRAEARASMVVVERVAEDLTAAVGDIELH